jgi:MrcB-like, N-terminal domain/AAA domain (dynein-related subfamily)
VIEVGANPIRERLQEILAGYGEAKRRKGVGEQSLPRVALREACERFEASVPVRARATVKVSSSTGTGRWAEVPWIAFLDTRVTSTIQSGVTVMLLFRADMTGVYLAVTQGVNAETKAERQQKRGKKTAWGKLSARARTLRPQFAVLEPHGFRLDDGIELESRSDTSLGYKAAVIAHKLYPQDSLPDDVALLADLDAALDAYRDYVVRRIPTAADFAALDEPGPEERLTELIAAIAARGFVFEPWQIAAYVTALRTKPFVILAGVSGTGKSQLPQLVAELTGGESKVLAVRPDWTDSSDVLGYTDLAGRFRPGQLLDVAKQATARPEQHHVAVLDEMNLARVEHYFAEVLSRIEDRHPLLTGGFASRALLGQSPAGDDAPWGEVKLPANLALVGTVNMDETTHGFSRKVLDRAFSLEISDVDLSIWEVKDRAAITAPRPWPVEAFRPRALRLGALEVTATERSLVKKAIEAIEAINDLLRAAQLQVGYRVRDEIALFLLHAFEVKGAFKTRKGTSVDPLDLALMMKILPRIAGGSASIREVVTALFGWASQAGKAFSEEEATRALDAWQKSGRPPSIARALYPRMAARLALMFERLLAEGYTSFWA